MGVGHVPQDPLRPQGSGADLQGRQRRRAAAHGALDGDRAGNLAAAARGRWGEDQAARWYRQRGGQILERNWRTSFGELDLIVELGGEIVFVEVKTRAGSGFGGPVAAVGYAKQRRIRRLASEWLAQREDPSRCAVRFDVVSISGVAIEVFESAF